MKTYLYPLIITLLSAISLRAQESTDLTLEDMRQQFKAATEEAVSEFEQYSEKARMEYELYEQQMRQEYESYVNSIKKVWGNDSIVEDSPTKWVEYGDDYKSRTVVDFDNNEILVEIAVDENEKDNDALVEQQLAKTIEKMLNSRGSTCPYRSGVDKSEPLTERPILEGIVDLTPYQMEDHAVTVEATPQKTRKTPPQPKVRGKELNLPEQEVNENPQIAAGGGKKMSDRVKEQRDQLKEQRKKIKEQNAQKAQSKAKPKAAQSQPRTIAKAVVKQTPQKKVKVKGADNKERTVVQVKMNLVADNISKNAALYKDYIAKYSEKFQIEQPLIYAVMEQESRFNPEATSWVPAYGLMQLVPKSGGCDAYRFVYKKEWVPSKSYLYVPHQNIELGTAYLRVLMNQFSSVTDPECRRLCVIASYNTGAGNVSRAFIGSTKLKKAIPMINQLNYQQLYDHLTHKLSTEEARGYVSGVSKRREKYLKK